MFQDRPRHRDESVVHHFAQGRLEGSTRLEDDAGGGELLAIEAVTQNEAIIAVIEGTPSLMLSMASVAHKLDPYKAIIDARLEAFPKLSAKRLFDEVRAADYPGCYSRVNDYVGRGDRANRLNRWSGLRRRRGVRARWTSVRSRCPGAGAMPW